MLQLFLRFYVIFQFFLISFDLMLIKVDEGLLKDLITFFKLFVSVLQT